MTHFRWLRPQIILESTLSPFRHQIIKDSVGSSFRLCPHSWPLCHPSPSHPFPPGSPWSPASRSCWLYHAVYQSVLSTESKRSLENLTQILSLLCIGLLNGFLFPQGRRPQNGPSFLLWPLGQCSPPCLSYSNPAGFPVAPLGPQTHSDLRAFVPTGSSTRTIIPNNVLMADSLPLLWSLFSNVTFWLRYKMASAALLLHRHFLSLFSILISFGNTVPHNIFIVFLPQLECKFNEDKHVLHCLHWCPSAKKRAW